MRTRFAHRNDYPAVLHMARAMLSESRFSRHSINEGKIITLFESLIDNPASSCLLLACDVEGCPVGMLAAQAEEYCICDGLRVQDRWFYVMAEYRHTSAAAGLLSALRRWAELRGAHEICISTTVAIGMEHFGGMMTRMGFQRCGSSHSLALTQSALANVL
jgi:GNAT superfamily N-acetyltransferase